MIDPNVEKIEPTKARNNINVILEEFLEPDPSKRRKRRVVFYARSSTKSSTQRTSYEYQKDVYNWLLKTHENWENCGFYGDYGRSGTLLNRPGFQQMLKDAEAGKFDLIVTKTISRFSRNVLVTLDAIRKLTELGVEVYFMHENISSMDPMAEELIRPLAILSQGESEDISSNVWWGINQKMQKGEFALPYANFLGYKKGKGKPEIDKKGAKVVREIFELYNNGMPIYSIVKYLNRLGRKTPSETGKWRASAVLRILKNEKYTGSAELNKTFVLDPLEHKAIKNKGQVDKFLAFNSHPQIISMEVFGIAQAKLARENHEHSDFYDEYLKEPKEE